MRWPSLQISENLNLMCICAGCYLKTVQSHVLRHCRDPRVVQQVLLETYLYRIACEATMELRVFSFS